MSVKLWLCALETRRLNSQGGGRWASVESVSGRREKYSLGKISVQGEEQHPGLWERDWPNSRAWKVIVRTCSFKKTLWEWELRLLFQVGNWPDNRDERTVFPESKRDTAVKKSYLLVEGSSKSDSWKGKTSQRWPARKEDPVTAAWQ